MRAAICLLVLALGAVTVWADEAGRLATAGATGVVNLDVAGSGDAQASYSVVLQAPAGPSRVLMPLSRMEANLDTARVELVRGPEGATLGDPIITPELPGMAVYSVEAPAAGELELRVEHPLKGVEFRVEHALVLDPAAGTATLDSTGVLVNRSRLDIPSGHVTLPGGMTCDLGLPRDWEVRVSLQHLADLPYRLVMRYDPAKSATEVTAWLRLVAPATEGARPLLAGPVRISTKEPPLVLCDENLPYLLPGESCEVRLGTVRELTVSRAAVRSAQIAVRSDVRDKLVLFDMEDALEWTVGNPRNVATEVVITEKVEGDWSVRSCDAAWTRLDADTLEVTVPLAAGETRKVGCVVRRHYLQPQ